MSVKLGRVVFRKIGGRIVPIRVGAESKTIAAGIVGVSKAAIKKAKLLFQTKSFKIGKSGNILKLAEEGSTTAMIKFMDKTGAIRFDNNSGLVDMVRKPTLDQKMTLAAAMNRKPTYVDITSPKGVTKASDSFDSFSQALKSGIFSKASKNIPMNGGKRDIEATKLYRKAKGILGLTDDPREAGFITRGGKMLDLSGKRDGGPGGVRYLDHREVSQLIKFRAKKPTDKQIVDEILKNQHYRKLSQRIKHKK